MREDKFWEQDTVIDKYHAPNASYEMSVRDYVLRPSADAESGPIVITLPGVVEARGRLYSIVVRAADGINSVTIQDKDDSEAWGGDYPAVCAGKILFYSDGASWNAIYGAIGVISTRTTIAAEDVKTLRATPVTLVPALGTGRILEFLSATLVLDYGSEVLAETDDNLAIKYTNGSGVAVSDTIEMTGFIDQTADTVTRGVPVKDAIVTLAGSANQALVLHNTGGGEMTGNASDDSVLTVFTLFRVADIN